MSKRTLVGFLLVAMGTGYSSGLCNKSKYVMTRTDISWRVRTESTDGDRYIPPSFHKVQLCVISLL